MRWEDEQFVKVYTRDTGEWLALGWEAQALFLLMLRKADRAGLVHAGRARVRGLAGMTAMPVDVVGRALAMLVEDGCVRECDGGYVIPSFVAAQEARQTDRARKALQRQRDRDTAATGGVTQPMVADMMAASERAASHEVTPAVTSGHAPSRAVTLRLDETRREETREDLPPASQAAPPLALVAPPSKQRKKPPVTPDPRHKPLLTALEAIGFPIRGGIDAKAVSNLLALADRLGPSEAAPGEILRRARIGWGWVGFPACKSLTELHANWGHYAKAQAGPTASPGIPTANDPGWVTR